MKNQNNKTKIQVLPIANKFALTTKEITANSQLILASYSSESFKLWDHLFFGSICCILTLLANSSKNFKIKKKPLIDARGLWLSMI